MAIWIVISIVLFFRKLKQKTKHTLNNQVKLQCSISLIIHIITIIIIVKDKNFNKTKKNVKIETFHFQIANLDIIHVRVALYTLKTARQSTATGHKTCKTS